MPKPEYIRTDHETLAVLRDIRDYLAAIAGKKRDTSVGDVADITGPYRIDEDDIVRHKRHTEYWGEE